MKIRKLDFQEKEEEGERTSDDVIRADLRREREIRASLVENFIGSTGEKRREMKGFGGGGGK